MLISRVSSRAESFHLLHVYIGHYSGPLQSGHKSWGRNTIGEVSSHKSGTWDRKLCPV